MTMRALWKRLAAGLAVPLLLALAAPADARPAKHRPKKPRITTDARQISSPSAKYGALTKDACLKELRRRAIPFVEVSGARGVLAPVRLSGPVGGIVYRTELPAAERPTSPFEVFDCRLVLALDDFGPILTKHGVEEALIFSAWRPPAKSWPADKPATRHPGALAVDIRRLVKAKPAGAGPKDKAPDLVVERDWTPARDVAPCAATTPILPATAEAREIRAIYCEAADARLFTTQLGPNYDKPHANHFHLEVTPGVSWRLLL
jgi:hypothetical protein